MAESRQSKGLLVLLIFGAGVAMWMVQQVRLHRLQATVSQARAQQSRSDERAAALNSELESAREELHAIKSSRTRAEADVATLEGELAKTDPEVRWVIPPATVPDWNPDSPYVWLRKDMVPRLPVRVFTEAGEIQPEVGVVLTVDPKQMAILNATLARLLADYRTLESAQARRIDDHLPGIAGEEGLKATVQVDPLPEDGKRFQQQFEAALTQTLGQQRADLLVQTGNGWLQSQFSNNGSEPKTISVIRHPNGTYNVSIKSAGNWMSTGGPAQVVTNQIPAYLLPLFSDVLTPVPEEAQQ